ncbi:hypothetical protein HLVA_15500 [Haliovirga abyssi]|uniref:2-amino-4-hydroxy-6-hydroxymethyldihydropteridine diphosphokinase n=1 Tax=Haliovirga abyssi TaxID=2996794 RepID=A0AAU9D4M3_9FUSO|nr:2-amino-4-hydroxy-6-hydroxymethyldihydropteridine diphosphokinase [Haliovirga abyssi]BDU50981.1 hypothetical protein HLVA_15500 [Haliovirga abyssi]
MKKNRNVYLSIGSNIGDKFFNILNAIFELNNLNDSFVVRISKLYKTEPYGYLEQDYFINVGIWLKTKLLPYELLDEIGKIELKLKRKREIKWGPRTIDIDIIFYENIKVDRTDLQIPHKEYKKRNFVLHPLKDIYYNKNILKYYSKASGRVEIYKNFDKILVSSCLLGINCKYNGGNNSRKFLKEFLKKFCIVSICPEQLGGLSTPRVPAERFGEKVVNKKGEDVSLEFYNGAKEAGKIAKVTNAKYAMLKAKSPSCGFGKIYDGSFTGRLINGNGVAADFLEKKGIKIFSV